MAIPKSLIAAASMIRAGSMRGRRIAFRLVGILSPISERRRLLRRAELARVQRRPMLEQSIRNLVKAIETKNRARVDEALERVDYALGTAGLKYNEEYLTEREEIWRTTDQLMRAIEARQKKLDTVTARLAPSRVLNSLRPAQRSIRKFRDPVSQSSRRASGPRRKANSR
jgi:ABC-type transporter Mla subunit MlaD